MRLASDWDPHVASATGACPICSANDQVRMKYPSGVERWRDLDVLVCRKCGFGFVPKVDFDLDAYYADAYGDTHGRSRLTPTFFETIDDDKSKKVSRSRGHAKLLREKFGIFDSVLDIGCGPGFFLHYVEARQKFALESDRRSQPMLKAIGAKVVKSLDEVKNLDLIVMSHVLEHFVVDQYRDFLRLAMSKLKPGGVMLIEVPETPRLDEAFRKVNNRGHEPHTMFFSSAGLLDAVDGELVYFHDRKAVYPVADGEVAWDKAGPRQKFPSSMMAIWRRGPTGAEDATDAAPRTLGARLLAAVKSRRTG